MAKWILCASFLVCIISSASAEVYLPSIFNFDSVTLAASQPVNPFVKIGKLHTRTIERLTQAKGQYDRKDQSFKITVPRNDLDINVNGVKMTAAMGLTSWVTFKKIDENNVTMKANLVLTENQINAVMSTVLNENFNVTALHNHLLWESPKVMFMHIEGQGDESNVAAAVGRVLKQITNTSNGKGDFPLAYIDASETTLNPQRINNVLGVSGKMSDGVYHVAMNKTPSDKNLSTPAINAAVIFAGSDNAAVIDGSLVVGEADLQRVLKALHQADISIVAIHQHAADATPLVYLHYFGVGKTTKLARGVKDALDAAEKNEELVARNTRQSIVPTEQTPLSFSSLNLSFNKIMSRHKLHRQTIF